MHKAADISTAIHYFLGDLNLNYLWSIDFINLLEQIVIHEAVILKTLGRIGSPILFFFFHPFTLLIHLLKKVCLVHKEKPINRFKESFFKPYSFFLVNFSNIKVQYRAISLQNTLFSTLLFLNHPPKHTHPQWSGFLDRIALSKVWLKDQLYLNHHPHACENADFRICHGPTNLGCCIFNQHPR